MTLTLNSLTKTYGAQVVLREVSLAVAAGERVALLGHNGAGKSTLMKIILGLIPFDKGTLQVMGSAAGSAAARRHVAYLPENAAFHPALTGVEQMHHYLALRGEKASLAMGLLDRVGLASAANRRIGTYSKGMRQRVGLAQTLIGTPKLLVLDEPTSGLDPVSRRDFYELLDGLAADGAAILLSSHALTEVEARTDRIVILSGGVLVAQGTLSSLRHSADLPVTLHITPHLGAEVAVALALPEARSVAGILTLTCAQGDKLRLLARVCDLGAKVADIDVHPPSLEDIYSHFSKRAGQ